MFKSFVLKEENKRLKEEITKLADIILERKTFYGKLIREKDKIEIEKDFLEREYKIKTEEKLNSLRKEMQESLIKSDLLRIEALAKLEIYEKTNTKADANTIKEMVTQLIATIGKQGINVIK